MSSIELNYLSLIYVKQTIIVGLQVTDDNGVAIFHTIYPGWYTGRATHIHIKVHINGTVADANGVYTGGHVSHTGKFK